MAIRKHSSGLQSAGSTVSPHSPIENLGSLAGRFEQSIPGPQLRVWLFPLYFGRDWPSEAIGQVESALANLSPFEYWTSLVLEVPAQPFGVDTAKQAWLWVGGIAIFQAPSQGPSMEAVQGLFALARGGTGEWGNLFPGAPPKGVDSYWLELLLRLSTRFRGYQETNACERDWLGLLLRLALSGGTTPVRVPAPLWNDCQLFIPWGAAPCLPVWFLAKLRSGTLPPPPAFSLPGGPNLSSPEVLQRLKELFRNFSPPWPLVLVTPDLCAISAVVCRQLTAQASKTEPVQQLPEFCFWKSGEVWFVKAFGKEFFLPDLRGAKFLYKLIENPQHRVPMREYYDRPKGMDLRKISLIEDKLSTDRPLDSMADQKTIRAVKAQAAKIQARLEEIDQQLTSPASESFLSVEDKIRLEEERYRLTQDLEQYKRYLASVLGLRIRTGAAGVSAERPFPSKNDKLRSAIAKSLRRVFDAIAQHDPELAKHFEANIRASGSCFQYDNPLPWKTEQPNKT